MSTTIRWVCDNECCASVMFSGCVSVLRHNIIEWTSLIGHHWWNIHQHSSWLIENIIDDNDMQLVNIIESQYSLSQTQRVVVDTSLYESRTIPKIHNQWTSLRHNTHCHKLNESSLTRLSMSHELWQRYAASEHYWGTILIVTSSTSRRWYVSPWVRNYATDTQVENIIEAQHA